MNWEELNKQAQGKSSAIQPTNSWEAFNIQAQKTIQEQKAETLKVQEAQKPKPLGYLLKELSPKTTTTVSNRYVQDPTRSNVSIPFEQADSKTQYESLTYDEIKKMKSSELVDLRRKAGIDKGDSKEWYSSFMAGIGDIMTTVGSTIKWKGAEGGLIDRIGENIQEAGKITQSKYTDYEALDKLGEFDWADLKDVSFWQNKAPRMLPFTMSLIPAAIIGGSLGATASASFGLGALVSTITGAVGSALLSRPLEGMMEAGSTYDEAIAKGFSEEEAQKAANEVFIENLKQMSVLDVVQMLTFTKNIKGFKIPNSTLNKIVNTVGTSGAIASEGLEEVLQNKIVANALGEKFDLASPETKESFVLGTIMGGVFQGSGGIVNISQRAIANATKENLSKKNQAIFKMNFDKFMKEGETRSDSEALALNEVAKIDQKGLQDAITKTLDEKAQELKEAGIEQQASTVLKEETPADKLAKQIKKSDPIDRLLSTIEEQEVETKAEQSLLQEAKGKSLEEFVKAPAKEDVETITVINQDGTIPKGNRVVMTEKIKTKENAEALRDEFLDDLIKIETEIKEVGGREKATTKQLLLRTQAETSIKALDIIKDELPTKSQLTDIWNKANKNVEIEPLIQEAKKYKSAEEFVIAMKTKHRPPDSEGGSPLNDLEMMFPDIYSVKGDRYYASYGMAGEKQAMEIIREMKDKPDADITIYRSVNPDEKTTINAGDWVTIVKDYAKQHGESNLEKGYKIASKKVKASDIFNDGNSIVEWGYRPEGHKDLTRTELADLWNKAHEKPTIKKETPKVETKSTEEPLQEARKYKSAEEFVKAQGTPVYHGGTEIKEVGNMRSKWGAFYMTDNPTYAKSYGGNKSFLNEMVITPEAKLADLRKPSSDIVKQIEDIISPKKTGKTFKIQKPDGSFIEVPETKGGLSNPVHSSDDIIQGIKDGKAYYAEMPEVKEALKKLGYDGMITQESKFGANYGVWNKDVIKTKSQLTDIWNKAHEKPTIKTGIIERVPIKKPAPIEKIKIKEVKPTEALKEEKITTENFSKHYERIKGEFGYEQSSVLFETISTKDQVKRAFEYINRFPKQALQIAYGLREAPASIKAIAIRQSLAVSLREKGEIAKASEIAKMVSRELTEAAQTLNLAKTDLGIKEETAIMNSIEQSRIESIGEKLGKIKDGDIKEAVRKEIRRKTEKATKEVVESQSKKTDKVMSEIDSLVNNIICK